jgi:hypothetical protein
MKYKFQIGDIVWDYDTDSPEFKSRVQWVLDKAIQLSGKLLRCKEMLYHTTSPQVVNLNPVPGTWEVTTRVNILYYKTPEITDLEACAAIDSAGFMTDDGPRISLQIVNLVLGLGIAEAVIVAQKYAPPKPEVAKADWEAPDSPMGPPWRPGSYKHKGGSAEVGQRWTGPSGKVYELKRVGTLFAWHEWVAVS